MKQPEGFVVEGKEHMVCRLKQSLYGLKQSPRCWNSTLDAHLKDMGYVQSTNDPCIYTLSEGELSIIGVYVDDFVATGESSGRIEQVKTALAQKFDVKDLGELHYFLGVQVIQDHERGTVWIGQLTFTESVLQKYDMNKAKPIKTPVNVNSKHQKSVSLLIQACTSQQLEAYFIWLRKHIPTLRLLSTTLLIFAPSWPNNTGWP